MNVKELSDKDLQAVVDNFNAARQEIAARQQKKVADEKVKLLESDKVKKLHAKYKKAMEKIEEAGGKHELSVTLPVTFTVETEVYDFCKNGNGYYQFGNIFNRQVTGEIGKAEGINKKQRLLLEGGLESVIEQACDEIYGLFPQLLKDQLAAVDDLNKVAEEARELGLSLADLDATV